MVRPRRSETMDLQQAIIDTAWEQIAESGAAALSLRAIARQLGITAPAIYNYFTRRDDLVTALIIDAYTLLGDMQFAAIEGLPEGDHWGRLLAVGQAYRQFALAHPQRYQLIFGTPIPGYDAPPERTVPAAARSFTALVGVLEAAHQAGAVRPVQAIARSEGLRQQFVAWQAIQPGASSEALYLALVVWARVHGLVSLEIVGQYPPFIEDPQEIYRFELEAILKETLLQ